MEQPDPTFYDGLTTLTAIGAITERIQLGTGSLIPFRRPIGTALTIGTLTAIAGDQVIIGMGAGTFDHEFEVVVIGVGGIPRVELVVERLLLLFSEDDVSYEDEHYRFEHVTIAPKPKRPLPCWYLRGDAQVRPPRRRVRRRVDTRADHAAHDRGTARDDAPAHR
jgi:alkanesulfonate monooxygenase SsuD/methylene tetrahydromethanopterin reductase-like flavin-dependent oxidoreductase (luciferase family)